MAFGAPGDPAGHNSLGTLHLQRWGWGWREHVGILLQAGFGGQGHCEKLAMGGGGRSQAPFTQSASRLLSAAGEISGATSFRHKTKGRRGGSK